MLISISTPTMHSVTDRRDAGVGIGGVDNVKHGVRSLGGREVGN
jgi:hypothetical protein